MNDQMNIEMHLNPADYIQQFNYFDSIRNYITDHFEYYEHFRKKSLTLPISDTMLCEFLRKENKAVLGNDKENDTFRNFINHLSRHPASVISRENLMRLCFVLKLRSVDDANDFFTNYMHTSVLSARNLREFIALAGLKLQMTWGNVCELFHNYDAQLTKQKEEHNAPDNLDEYSARTAFILNTLIWRIDSPEILNQYLTQPDNQQYFATTRNTIYLRLFDDLILRERKDSVILLEGDKRYPVLDYYQRLFGLCSLDEAMFLSDGKTLADNFLTEQEISTLTTYFPDVFMNYDAFTNVVNRTRTVDISYGTYLLHLLLTIEASDSAAYDYDTENDTEYDDIYDYFSDFGVDYREPDEFLNHFLNHSLISVGLPGLDEAAGFDRLIMDTYDEVLESITSETTSKDIQAAFLHNLRSYLKQIAAIRPSGAKGQTI